MDTLRDEPTNKSRRRFLRTASQVAIAVSGVGGAVETLAACAPTTMEERVQKEMDSSQPEAPQWLKNREIQIQVHYEIGLPSGGSGVVLKEDEHVIYILVLDHEIYKDGIKGVDVINATGQYVSRAVGDFTVHRDPRWKENHNPLCILAIHKKRPDEHLIGDSGVPNLEISDRQPTSKESLYSYSYPAKVDPTGEHILYGHIFENNDHFEGVVNGYEDGNHQVYPQLWVIKGDAWNGSSSAGIFDKNRELMAVVVGPYSETEYVAMPVKGMIEIIPCDKPETFNLEEFLEQCKHPSHVEPQAL